MLKLNIPESCFNLYGMQGICEEIKKDDEKSNAKVYFQYMKNDYSTLEVF